MTKKRVGRQTPTRLIKQEYEKSEYKKAIEYYENSNRKSLEWQKNLLDPILGVNEEGLWTHTKIGYSIPRRNGKGEILLIRELYGLFKGEQIIHTAHRANTSHSAWERLCRVLDDSEIPYTSLRAKGNENIKLVDTDGRIEFRTRTTTGGLGEGFDLLVIDEAQEYTNDQESTLKYMVSSSKNPQTIMCGTPPTPLSSGTVFTNFRKSLLNNPNSNFMWAEWGVNQKTDVNDKDSWYKIIHHWVI